jgi:dTDP-4-amino-4,6-dideoxy-D-galactose acyltransferase
MAGMDDIPDLREVARRMRNRFDRVHADPAFTDEEADGYLATFAEQSVRGFADMVAVPDLPGVKPFGFLAAGNPERITDLNIARLVLAAVDNREHRGWMFHLLEAVIQELKKKDTDILTTITQASNRPAIRTWEKAGFMLGFINHVYSYSTL